MSSCRTVASYAELGELVRAIAPPRAFPRLGSLLGPNKIRNALKNDEFQSDCGEFCTLAQIASRYLREVARTRAAWEGGMGGYMGRGGAVPVMMDELSHRGPTRVGQVVMTRSDEPKGAEHVGCLRRAGAADGRTQRGHGATVAASGRDQAASGRI
eukprot:6015127-Pyramimonas_sp.AAC.1